ncbi:hypothetical protein [Chitinophaga nivalis]|uniref:Lipoprotein n=1 Tax=Chitinophaga nivalis TaxID=2991709 RepID=A0ABT3IQS9_9BACT|nr:hypothetical protein [Chitinophaga nivalis]MCW3463969.1 hypothetical protein [Chitinophaga nivalis]MCW3486341.1 hypothetical protein [Chitinophaga nivalis]
MMIPNYLIIRKVFLAIVLLLLIASCNNDTLPVSHHADTTKEKSADTVYMRTGFYFLADTLTGIKMQEKNSDKIYSIEKLPFASVDNIIECKIQDTKIDSTTYKNICIKFDAKGTKDLQDGTESPFHPKIALIIANRLLYVVDNRTSVKDGAVCAYLIDFSQQEINAMKEAIEQKR